MVSRLVNWWRGGAPASLPLPPPVDEEKQIDFVEKFWQRTWGTLPPDLDFALLLFRGRILFQIAGLREWDPFGTGARPTLLVEGVRRPVSFVLDHFWVDPEKKRLLGPERLDPPPPPEARGEGVPYVFFPERGLIRYDPLGGRREHPLALDRPLPFRRLSPMEQRCLRSGRPEGIHYVELVLGQDSREEGSVAQSGVGHFWIRLIPMAEIGGLEQGGVYSVGFSSRGSFVGVSPGEVESPDSGEWRLASKTKAVVAVTAREFVRLTEWIKWQRLHKVEGRPLGFHPLHHNCATFVSAALLQVGLQALPPPDYPPPLIGESPASRLSWLAARMQALALLPFRMAAMRHQAPNLHPFSEEYGGCLSPTAGVADLVFLPPVFNPHDLEKWMKENRNLSH